MTRNSITSPSKNTGFQWPPRAKSTTSQSTNNGERKNIVKSTVVGSYGPIYEISDLALLVPLGDVQDNTQASQDKLVHNETWYSMGHVMAVSTLAAVTLFIIYSGPKNALLLLRQLAINIWHSYKRALADSPIITNAVTSATVYTIGDVISQRTKGNYDLDHARTTRSLLAGLIGHGPMSHCWYILCDSMFENVLHLTAWWSFLPKAALDQLTWGPFWNNAYILLIGIMKLESLKAIWADMKRTTVPLIISGLKLWPLAHCITYGLIPVEYRLLWVDTVEIFWVIILATQAAGGSASGEKEDNTKVAAPSVPAN